jgi:hypothetical protein
MKVLWLTWVSCAFWVLASVGVFVAAAYPDDTVLSIERHGDVVTVYVPGERATVPLDTFRQILFNEGIR